MRLSGVARQIVDALIGSPSAWVSPILLAQRLGWPEGKALDAIADLEAKCLVDVYVPDQGQPIVILSLQAQQLLGIDLVAKKRGRKPAWKAGEAVKRPKLVSLEDPTARIDQPPVGWHPHEQEPYAPDRNHLLGLRPIWPVRVTPGQACPGCGGHKLDPGQYCLVCDRWGWDGLSKPVEKPEPARGARTRST